MRRRMSAIDSRPTMARRKPGPVAPLGRGAAFCEPAVGVGLAPPTVLALVGDGGLGSKLVRHRSILS